MAIVLIVATPPSGGHLHDCGGYTESGGSCRPATLSPATAQQPGCCPWRHRRAASSTSANAASEPIPGSGRILPGSGRSSSTRPDRRAPRPPDSRRGPRSGSRLGMSNSVWSFATAGLPEKTWWKGESYREPSLLPSTSTCARWAHSPKRSPVGSASQNPWSPRSA